MDGVGMEGDEEVVGITLKMRSESVRSWTVLKGSGSVEMLGAGGRGPLYPAGRL